MRWLPAHKRIIQTLLSVSYPKVGLAGVLSGRTGRALSRHTDRQAGRQADRQAGRQTDRQAVRQAGRQAVRQAGRQADIHRKAIF